MLCTVSQRILPSKCTIILFHYTIGASKGGLDMLTKVMGLELGPHKVNMIEGKEGGKAREGERERES